MNKRFAAVVAALLLSALLLPVAAMLLLQQYLPPVFGESYYAALQDKYDALTADWSGRDGRILLIGGSGTAFSVDGALLEEETGMPCVNFALYAAFGSQYMMELAKSHIREGDIVILCPELSEQTLSMYFGADAALQASEGELSLLLGARLADYPAILAAFPAYLQKKLSFLLPENAAPPLPEGVYARSSFDEKGNMIYRREENVMPYGYLPDALPTLSPDAYDEAFLDYLCDYAEAAAKKGAKVYYAFPFLNRLSLSEADEDDMAALESFLMERLNFPLLSALSSRILDEGYFYDSNYHTTSDGSVAATLRLAQDIKRLRGDNSPLKNEAPPPLLLDTDGGESEEFTDGIWRYRVRGGTAVLTGLTEEGLAEGELTLPATLGGYPLTVIGREAFKDCAAESITLPESVRSLEGALFSGCGKLRALHLQQSALPSVGDRLLDGFDGALRIYVPAALYGDYVTDYFWLAYSEYLAEE